MEIVVYILYAQADALHEQALAQQLAVFERVHKVLRLLRDQDVTAGSRALARKERAVDQADIVVLLVTPAFWDLYGLALRAMAQQKHVVPVLVRSTPWTEVPLGQNSPLPTGERFIDDWPNKDAAWLDVAQGLKRLWEVLDLAALRSSFVRASAALVASQPVRPASPLAADESVRILFVSANPSVAGRHRLGEEAERMRQGLLRRPYGSRFVFVMQPGLRANELAVALMRHKPHIVHFGGNEEGTGVLTLNGQEPASVLHPMDPLALRQMFSVLRDNLRLVVLSGCYSSAQPEQAQALAEAAGCAICTDSELGTAGVTAFATAFYDALGFGRSIQDAVELGKTSLVTMGYPSVRLAQLIAAPGADLAPPFLPPALVGVDGEQPDGSRIIEPAAMRMPALLPTSRVGRGLAVLLIALAGVAGAMTSYIHSGIKKSVAGVRTASQDPAPSVPGTAMPTPLLKEPPTPSNGQHPATKPPLIDVVLEPFDEPGKPTGGTHSPTGRAGKPRSTDKLAGRPAAALCKSSDCFPTGSAERDALLVSEGIAACKEHNGTTAQIKLDLLGVSDESCAELRRGCEQYEIVLK